jgi:hypothetical protein
LENNYGPFDYRSATHEQLRAERAHFQPQTEILLGGSTGDIGPDLSYTLRVYPNHYRALMSTMNFARQHKADPAPGVQYTIACYFDRALRFRRDDHLVRLLYAHHLIGSAKADEARAQLDYVARVEQDNPITVFNTGMLFFDNQDYERAIALAHRAMAMGMQRDELRKRLESVNLWREPAGSPGAPSSGR